jgi:uncharacterized protein (UPF0332 family)
MPRFKTKEEAYNDCKAEGFFRETERVDIEKIKSTLKIADEDFESARITAENKKYNSAYKLYYDVLHELVESFLLFDKIKSLNHQCLFSHLCIKHPELELSWEFFEKIRTKRNGINYYGEPVNEKDWKEIQLQMNIYIKSIKKEIEKKIKEF